MREPKFATNPAKIVCLHRIFTDLFARGARRDTGVGAGDARTRGAHLTPEARSLRPFAVETWPEGGGLLKRKQPVSLILSCHFICICSFCELPQPNRLKHSRQSLHSAVAIPAAIISEATNSTLAAASI